MTQHEGRVTWFDRENGNGFPAYSHAADVFADTHLIEERSRYLLKEGDRVSFSIIDSDAGAKACSVVKNKDFAHTSASTGQCVHSFAKRTLRSAKLVVKEPQIILLIADAEESAIHQARFLRAAGYLVVTCNDIPMAFDVHRSNMPVGCRLSCKTFEIAPFTNS